MRAMLQRPAHGLPTHAEPKVMSPDPEGRVNIHGDNQVVTIQESSTLFGDTMVPIRE